MKHLDDDILQRYLEEGHSVLSEQQIEHLEGCDYCGNRMQLYRHVFQSLQSGSQEVLLPEDFDTQVMHRIAEVSTGTISWLEYGVTIAGAIGSIILMMIYLPGNWVATTTEKFISILLTGFQKFFQEAYITLEKSGLSPLWLLAILVGAGIIILLDQIFVRSRFQ